MSDTQRAHFQNLLDLLHQEKAEDYRSFLQLVRENPLSERVAQGYTRVPVGEARGELAIRGGGADVFALGASHPLLDEGSLCFRVQRR